MPGTTRTQTAKAGFRRLIGYLVVAGAAMVAAALYYLSTYGPLTTTLVIAVAGGVFVSIVLGGGLMAMGFYSSNSGHDEAVADFTPPEAR